MLIWTPELLHAWCFLKLFLNRSPSLASNEHILRVLQILDFADTFLLIWVPIFLGSIIISTKKYKQDPLPMFRLRRMISSAHAHTIFCDGLIWQLANCVQLWILRTIPRLKWRSYPYFRWRTTELSACLSAALFWSNVLRFQRVYLSVRTNIYVHFTHIGVRMVYRWFRYYHILKDILWTIMMHNRLFFLRRRTDFSVTSIAQIK